MAHYNLLAAWLGIFLGLASGTAIGLRFHRRDWLGGYGAWPRRMLRLGHIALVGTGLLNLGFALSLEPLGFSQPPAVCSVLFLVGAATMPAVCFASASAAA